MLKINVKSFSGFWTNFAYGAAVFLALVVTAVFNHGANLENALEISGTFIQIALPCYVIVPLLVKQDKEGAKRMLWFLAITLVITYTLKVTVPIKRPYGGSMSFPSGHTVGAFSGVVFLGFRYGKKYFWTTLPLAIFVAFSRVYSRNHWLTDVLTSVFLCFLVGFFVVKKYSR